MFNVQKYFMVIWLPSSMSGYRKKSSMFVSFHSQKTSTHLQMYNVFKFFIANSLQRMIFATNVQCFWVHQTFMADHRKKYLIFVSFSIANIIQIICIYIIMFDVHKFFAVNRIHCLIFHGWPTGFKLWFSNSNVP